MPSVSPPYKIDLPLQYRIAFTPYLLKLKKGSKVEAFVKKKLKELSESPNPVPYLYNSKQIRNAETLEKKRQKIRTAFSRNRFYLISVFIDDPQIKRLCLLLTFAAHKHVFKTSLSDEQTKHFKNQVLRPFCAYFENELRNNQPEIYKNQYIIPDSLVNI